MRTSAKRRLRYGVDDQLKQFVTKRNEAPFAAGISRQWELAKVLALFALRFCEITRCVDETYVRKRLGKVSNHAFLLGVIFFG